MVSRVQWRSPGPPETDHKAVCALSGCLAARHSTSISSWVLHPPAATRSSLRTMRYRPGTTLYNFDDLPMVTAASLPTRLTLTLNPTPTLTLALALTLALTRCRAPERPNAARWGLCAKQAAAEAAGCEACKKPGHDDGALAGSRPQEKV